MTDKRPFEEMNTIAKQIKEQALVVTDDYFKLLKKAISSNPSKGTEVGAVLKSNVEKNIDLVQEYMHNRRRERPPRLMPGPSPANGKPFM